MNVILRAGKPDQKALRNRVSRQIYDALVILSRRQLCAKSHFAHIETSKHASIQFSLIKQLFTPRERKRSRSPLLSGCQSTASCDEQQAERHAGNKKLTIENPRHYLSKPNCFCDENRESRSES